MEEKRKVKDWTEEEYQKELKGLKGVLDVATKYNMPESEIFILKRIVELFEKDRLGGLTTDNRLEMESHRNYIEKRKSEEAAEMKEELDSISELCGIPKMELSDFIKKIEESEDKIDEALAKGETISIKRFKNLMGVKDEGIKVSPSKMPFAFWPKKT